MKNCQIFTSVRGEGASVIVTTSVTFNGPGAKAGDALQRLFTAPLADNVAALAQAASAAMEAAHEAQETVVSAALEAALTDVDPDQHDAIRKRFGLTGTATTPQRPSPSAGRP